MKQVRIHRGAEILQLIIKRVEISTGRVISWQGYYFFQILLKLYKQ